MTTAVGCQSSPTGDIYIASGSADSTVKLWHIVDTTGNSNGIFGSFSNCILLVTCLHTLDLKNGFAITLELVPLDTHTGGNCSSRKRFSRLLSVNFSVSIARRDG